MKNTMEYRSYIGSVEFSEEDCLLFGKVQGVRTLISYEGQTAKELLEDFHAAVNEYLQLCSEQGIAPEQSYKGSFNVRISPQLHRDIAIAAMTQNISMNACIEKLLIKGLSITDAGSLW